MYFQDSKHWPSIVGVERMIGVGTVAFGIANFFPDIEPDLQSRGAFWRVGLSNHVCTICQMDPDGRSTQE